MSTRHLIPFFAITSAISWGVPGVAFLVAHLVDGFSVSLEMYTPFYFVGVWGPAIAALILVARERGWSGLKSFGSRMLNWRFPAAWWGFALLLLPATYGAGALIHHLACDPDAIDWYDGSWLLLVGAVLLRATAGPVEELGWRGFALPLLQRRFSAWGAIGLLAAVHTLWHAPVFVVGQFGHFGTELPLGIALARFGGNILFVTIILSIAYNATRGSLTLAFLIHWVLNGIFPWEGEADLMLGQVIAMGFLVLVMMATTGRHHLKRERLHVLVFPDPQTDPARAVRT